MAARDNIGSRGEFIFGKLITHFCGRAFPYFYPRFLGEKARTLDLLVELVDPGDGLRYFFTQVRTTQQGYTRKDRRLKISMSQDELRRLSLVPAPTYLVGIDEPGEVGYIVAVLAETSGPIASLPTNFPLDCVNLPLLYQEVEEFWEGRNMTRRHSVFRV